MFPIITKLADLLPHIEGNKQIRVKLDEDTGHTVVCYMVQDEDTFAEDGASAAFAREARGITFGPDGKISARTLHKFFNVGERADTQPAHLNWTDVERIMEKRDGSMVTPVWVNGNLTFKTKKSFSTKEAALALEVCRATTDGVAFCLKMAEQGLTPTFEITSPRYPIVVLYEKDELTLLHVRENRTGRYLTQSELEKLGSPFPLVPNIINEFMVDMEMGCFCDPYVSWSSLEAAAMACTGIEGWVIQFKSGGMVKLKTDWYNRLHHAVTFVRWRDIARSVVADQADDLKGAFTLTGRPIDPILHVERIIGSKLRIVENTVELHVMNGKALNRTAKDMALAFKDHELFGLVMRAFRGQEINYLEWYEKHHLDKDWGLDVVGEAV